LRPEIRPVTAPRKVQQSTVTAVSWSRIWVERGLSLSLRTSLTSRKTPPEPTTNTGVPITIRIAPPNKPPSLPGASGAGKKSRTCHATAAISTTYSQ
jgi:hypothetical protein